MGLKQAFLDRLQKLKDNNLKPHENNSKLTQKKLKDNWQKKSKYTSKYCKNSQILRGNGLFLKIFKKKT